MDRAQSVLSGKNASGYARDAFLGWKCTFFHALVVDDMLIPDSMQPANTEPVKSTEENKHRIPLIYAITPKDPKEQELYLVNYMGRYFRK